MSNIDRRKFMRFVLTQFGAYDCVLEWNGNSLSATVLDISRGGMKVKCDKKKLMPEVGDRIFINTSTTSLLTNKITCKTGVLTWKKENTFGIKFEEHLLEDFNELFGV